MTTNPSDRLLSDEQLVNIYTKFYAIGAGTSIAIEDDQRLRLMRLAADEGVRKGIEAALAAVKDALLGRLEGIKNEFDIDDTIAEVRTTLGIGGTHE